MPTITSFMLLIFLVACQTQEKKEALRIEGYTPVYGTKDDLKAGFESPRAIKNPGKIYIYKQYLLVNEAKQGIHVFDNSNPANPAPVGFISIPGNSNMAIRNDILYADLYGNLVALSTSDFTSIQEKSRLPLREWYFGVPAPAGFYFECIDPEKGVAISWKKTQLINPACYAFN